MEGNSKGGKGGSTQTHQAGNLGGDQHHPLNCVTLKATAVSSFASSMILDVCFNIDQHAARGAKHAQNDLSVAPAD